MRLSKACCSIFTIIGIGILIPNLSPGDVTNGSYETIYVKEENSDKVHPVKPGETYRGTQDGIAVPAHEPGKIYKTVDDVDISVDKQGKVTPLGGNLYEQAGQIIIGGWKDDAFVAEHDDWAKLHEKSRIRTTEKPTPAPGAREKPVR